MHYIFEPGFFASGPVHVALAVGTVVAITSAVVGVFTVTRGQSFAGHSLADSAAGAGTWPPVWCSAPPWGWPRCSST